MPANSVIDFWFEELSEADWWRVDPTLDEHIAALFKPLLLSARRGELFLWRECARGRLAEIIVLDQFSRNIFRGSAEAFAADGMALALAQEALRSGAADELEPRQRAFLYMPYMHSESTLIHTQALQLFSAPGLENNLDFELKHKAIIDKFSRYPHRNIALGRESTAAELAFLQEPGSSF